MKLRKSLIGLVVICLILSLSVGMVSAATLAYDTQKTVTYTLTCPFCGQQSDHDVTFGYHVYDNGTWSAFWIECSCDYLGYSGHASGTGYYFRHNCPYCQSLIIKTGTVPSPF